MFKRIAIAAAALLLVVSVVGFFWARSVFANDRMRAALAAQMSAAIGQPVSIATISAGIYPRVTVNLGGVTIGQPVRIQAETLHLGTDFRALLSRQIVHGRVRLDGARVTLPLPALGSAAPVESGSGGWPVEIVSIDEVLLNGVEVISGGRTLRGDIELVPHGNAITLRKIALTAEDTSLNASGEITDLSGPVGHVELKAGALNFSRLIGFLADFASGAEVAGSPASRKASSSPANGKAATMDVTIALTAEKATLGTLALERLSGKARLTRDAVMFNPVSFGVFGGQSTGSLAVSLSGTPMFRLQGTLSNVDAAAAMAFLGSAGALTGKLAGRLDLTGASVDPSAAIGQSHGTARIDVQDGVVRSLGLVRTVITSTAMRANAPVAPASASNDDHFKKLGATLAIASGLARTSDLVFESPDVTMRAAGSMRLDGSAIDLRGNIQLSDALSQQAGRDLVRYTQEEGRVTLPVTVTGSVQAPVARIDTAQLALRAVKNKLNDEATKAIKRSLGNLFKK